MTSGCYGYGTESGVIKNKEFNYAESRSIKFNK